MGLQADIRRHSKAIAITSGVVLVAGGLLVWGSAGRTGPRESNLPPVQAKAPGTPTQESERYKQTLTEYNLQNAARATQSGESYLSVLSTTASAAPAPAEPPPPAPPFVTPVAQRAPDPNQGRKSDEKVDAIMKNWMPVAHSKGEFSDAPAYTASLVEARQPAASVVPGAANKRKVVADFALVPAILETSIDTDETSMVEARVPAGEYEGARVFAMGYKRITNSVDMTFTFMEWRGRSYKITAKAVDQETMRTSLSGEVNNRWMSRIVLPAIAAGIGRTGQLYEQANSQTILVPQVGVVQSRPTPDGRSIAGTVLGGMGTQAGQVLTSDAASMPVKQVLVERKTVIGIQFVGPVLESDDVAAGASGPQFQDAAAAVSQLAGPTPVTSQMTAAGQSVPNQPLRLNSPQFQQRQ